MKDKAMRFHYDHKKDAFSIRFADNAYAESDEVDDGVIFDPRTSPSIRRDGAGLRFDRRGKLVGIVRRSRIRLCRKILSASRKLSPPFKSALLRKEIPVSLGAPTLV